jgi:hypothetical protein
MDSEFFEGGLELEGSLNDLRDCVLDMIPGHHQGGLAYLTITAMLRQPEFRALSPRQLARRLVARLWAAEEWASERQRHLREKP